MTTFDKQDAECCVRLSDGTLSADRLHEQMCERVDDSDIRAKTRRRLLKKGFAPQQLDRVFPDLPPINVPDGA